MTRYKVYFMSNEVLAYLARHHSMICFWLFAIGCRIMSSHLLNFQTRFRWLCIDSQEGQLQAAVHPVSVDPHDPAYCCWAK